MVAGRTATIPRSLKLTPPGHESIAAQMLRCLLLIVVCGMSFDCRMRGACASSLPTPVQLGGAIVAAVEEDAEQAETDQQAQRIESQLAAESWDHDLWSYITDEADISAMERLWTNIEEARGKFHNRRKMLKYLYPLLVGVLIAKTVLVPLILKALTALSASSFVMSKIALVASGMLILKWIFSGSAGSEGGFEERKHLEIIHLPAPPLKSYRDAGGGQAGWHDMSLSGSTLIDSKTKMQRLKYIPLEGVAAGWRYSPQHNDNAYDGKPFL